MLIQNFIGQGTLSRSRYSGDTGHDTKRNLHINIFQIIFPRSFDGKESGRSAPFRWYRNLHPATQISTCNRFFAFHDIRCSTGRNDFSTMDAGCRTNIHNVVGRTHGILIMFHDNQRISQILKIHQCMQQLVIVPLMQSNTRLIQNICHADQSGTDLGSQADALRLSSGQGSGRTCQCQIIQTYLLQKAHTGTDFL